MLVLFILYQLNLPFNQNKTMETKQSISIEKDITLEANENQVLYLAKIGHELKTPIHGIQGLSEYLINNWDNTDIETKKKCLNSILEAGNSLMELVGTLSVENLKQTSINFSFEQADIVEVTKKTIDNFKNIYLVNSKISLELKISIHSFVSSIDEFWYKQLLTNLLVNAFNYSKDGIISVDIRSKVYQDSNSLIISIADQGIGIPESELNSIFIPYSRGSRTNSITQGSGLGLSICREIIQAHKGTIIAKNNKTIGSTIEFSIPSTGT